MAEEETQDDWDILPEEEQGEGEEEELDEKEPGEKAHSDDLSDDKLDADDDSEHDSKKRSQDTDELLELLRQARERVQSKSEKLIERQKSSDDNLHKRIKGVKEKISALSRANAEMQTMVEINNADKLHNQGSVEFVDIQKALRSAQINLGAVTDIYLQTAISYCNKTNRFNELLLDLLGNDEAKKEQTGEEEEELDEDTDQEKTGEEDTGEEEEAEEDEDDGAGEGGLESFPSFTMEAPDPDDEVADLEEEEEDEAGEKEGEGDEDAVDALLGEEDEGETETESESDPRIEQLIDIAFKHFKGELEDTVNWSKRSVQSHIGVYLPGGYRIESDGRTPTPLMGKEEVSKAPDKTQTKLPSVTRLRQMVGAVEGINQVIHRQREDTEDLSERLLKLIDTSIEAIEQIRSHPTGKKFFESKEHRALYRYIRGRFIKRIDTIHTYQIDVAEAALDFVEGCLQYYKGTGQSS